VTGIDEAQARWQQVRAKGRTRLIIVLVVAVVVLAVIAIVAKGSAGIVVGVVIGVLVVAAAIYLMVSKQKTGLSLTPEWAPKDRGRDDDDDEDDLSGAALTAAAEPAEPVEPIRKVDAQILGVDLAGLGQQIGPKLQSSYALGDLHVEGGKVSWVPSSISGGQGAQPLEAAPGEVAVIERVPLWGSWALLRLERSDASEWCFRIPSSVDLSPALSELGLTLR
jgi:flagellar basal body-associated protein FliL